MTSNTFIQSPADPELDRLCQQLGRQADAVDAAAAWPGEQLAWCADRGVLRWFAPQAWAGLEWTEAELLRGLMRLAGACLSTTFVLTQPAGALRRILSSENDWLKVHTVADILAGRRLASVGISHLTTSRRHLDRAVLGARLVGETIVLDGQIPWVTGGTHADWIVTGATLEDGRQLLVLLPTELAGVEPAEPARLVGLSATHTGEVACRHVELSSRWTLAGPVENVLSSAGAAGTGGLQTSALALGLAAAALDYLDDEAARRANLAAAADQLRQDLATAETDLLAMAAGEEPCTGDQLRARSNSLVLRATQAALTAAKGSGYVVGHPAGRWCREALFFLVWSCPQGVANAALCELAGLGSRD